MNEQTIGAYNYRIAVSDARYVETGAECDIEIEIRSAKDDSVVNVTTMTVLSTDAKKAKAARKNRKELTEKEKAAKVALSVTKDEDVVLQKLGKDHTLKYTAVSGDSNPIHHPTYCKVRDRNSLKSTSQMLCLTCTHASSVFRFTVPCQINVSHCFLILINVTP